MQNASENAMSATSVRRKQLFEDRWSTFGEHSGLTDLSEMLSASQLKQIDIFSDYDDEFLRSISQDISIGTWKSDVTLFEEGSYLDVAFYILEGHVDVYLQKHVETSHAPIFNPERTSFGTPLLESASDPDLPPQTIFQPKPSGKLASDRPITFLASMDFNLVQGSKKNLKTGDFFGEIGALNGWPQSATAKSVSTCRLVQIRLPALREMKSASDTFTERIDKVYRERELLAQLKTAPLFRGVADDFLETLANRVELVSLGPGKSATEQGDEADALYMVRSGFLKVTERVEDAELAVSYLSKGMAFGSVELLLPEQRSWRHSTSSVGFSELVKISRQEFESILQKYPQIEKRLWDAAVSEIKTTGNTRRRPDKSELIEFSLQKGLVQGNSMLVIDLDVCTRCDDCMRGCADTHGGRPRFVREGDKYDQFLIARSCYHCEDPVCLIGCPTGAIGRVSVGEVVAIDDALCIGCSSCATKCPYDAIVMHDTETTWPDDAVPEHLRGRPRKVASKCDLCYTAEDGPACVNNCPHSCAFRIGSLDDFQSLLSMQKGSA